jgi:ketosteroid isomerase-like protein
MASSGHWRQDSASPTPQYAGILSHWLAASGGWHLFAALYQEDASMSDGHVTDRDLAELIQRTKEATSAFIGGDMRRYVTLIRHADDYTLMAPYGGDPIRGFDGSDEHLDAMERYFKSGEGKLEFVQTWASGNLAVIVGVERQHGEVGGLADQEWSLRVTLVFRREGSEWYQIHRHADPLVHEMSLEQMAVIARG